MLVVETDSMRYELDTVQSRIRCTNLGPLPDAAVPYCDPVSLLPLCYLNRPPDAEGWAAFHRFATPTLNRSLRVTWPDGTLLTSMQVRSIEDVP